MTYSDGYAELASWIAQFGREFCDLTAKSELTPRHLETWVKGRLWEFVVLVGMIQSSIEQCESERRGCRPNPSAPADRSATD